MAETLAEGVIKLGTEGDAKAKAGLDGVHKSLSAIRALLMTEAFKDTGRSIAESLLGKQGGGQLAGALTGMAQGFAAAGVAGAAFGAVMGVVAADIEAAKEQAIAAQVEIRKVLDLNRQETRLFVSKQEAYRQADAIGGSSEFLKLLQLENSEIELQQKKLDELNLKAAAAYGNTDWRNRPDKDGKLKGIAEEIKREEDRLAGLEKRRDGVQRQANQSAMGEIRQSLFSLGQNDQERQVASVAKSYDDLIKQAKLLNVTEEERANILADINAEREKAIEKTLREIRLQDSLVGKMFSPEQFAKESQLNTLNMKDTIRADVLARIKEGPRMPGAAAGKDEQIAANTDATAKAVGALLALERQKVAVGAIRSYDPGPGE